MTEWEFVGYERNEDGEVSIIWECTECGFEIVGGMDKPECECMNCKRGVEE